jgi:FtsZ-binding cell division protein ZapB
MMQPVPQEETDALARLEEQIRRTAELVARLRAERDAAVQAKEAALEEASVARRQVERMAEELEALRNERRQVRARIEKLLGQMDVLAAG